MLVAALALGLVIGAVIGGLGGGGGVLTVPALVYLLGQSAQDATTGSVVIVGITAAASVLSRARNGGVDWRVGLAFGAVGIPAAWLGTLLNQHVSQPVLLLAFAALTITAAAAMLLNDGRPRRVADEADVQSRDGGADPPGGSGTRPAAPGTAGRTVATATRARSRRSTLAGLVAKVLLGGAAVGFLTGFLGVGGGFLVVPVLVVLLRMPMSLAVGTSLLIIVLNAVSSMSARIGVAHVDWSVIGPFTLAAIAGSLLGKRVADRLSGAALTRAFAILLVLVGLFVGAESLLAL